MATFPYTAAGPDELTLVVGDQVGGLRKREVGDMYQPSL